MKTNHLQFYKIRNVLQALLFVLCSLFVLFIGYLTIDPLFSFSNGGMILIATIFAIMIVIMYYINRNDFVEKYKSKLVILLFLVSILFIIDSLFFCPSAYLMRVNTEQMSLKEYMSLSVDLRPGQQLFTWIANNTFKHNMANNLIVFIIPAFLLSQFTSTFSKLIPLISLAGFCAVLLSILRVLTYAGGLYFDQIVLWMVSAILGYWAKNILTCLKATNNTKIS